MATVVNRRLVVSNHPWYGSRISVAFLAADYSENGDHSAFKPNAATLKCQWHDLIHINNPKDGRSGLSVLKLSVDQLAAIVRERMASLEVPFAHQQIAWSDPTICDRTTLYRQNVCTTITVGTDRSLVRNHQHLSCQTSRWIRKNSTAENLDDS